MRKEFELSDRIVIGILIAAILLTLAFVLAQPASAAPLAGNRGGCAEGNKWRMLPCTVTDTGVGWVSGTCSTGHWFDSIPSRRTWVLDAPVSLQGCEGPGYELYSAPGWPVRISKR